MDVYVYTRNVDLSFIHVRPGDCVVIKPNLIKEHKENDENEWRSVITSPDLIRDVCDYVCQRLDRSGRVILCDAPQTDSSFEKIAARLGLHEIARACSEAYKIEVQVLDLRNEEWTNEGGVIVNRRKLAGDPNGTIAFDLGRRSLFYNHRGEGRYYGADVDTQEVNRFHCKEKHEYLICATPVLADLFINMPKLKTHKKTGVTLSLKNLVGINADKNRLPHHTDGSPGTGGDQFPEKTLGSASELMLARGYRKMLCAFPWLGRSVGKAARKVGLKIFGNGEAVIRNGNWYGNDTAWRMVLDLNRCLLYGNPDGTFRDHSPKRNYSVIDGTIGMEGSGPMQGDPVRSNVVIGGSDPAAVDMVAARVMGFDWRKIPVIHEAFAPGPMPISSALPSEVTVISDVEAWNGPYLEVEKREFLRFKPHFGWAGRIEYNAPTTSAVHGEEC
ncbi:MAG: DUF362 domain-containing protein [Planctomycetota bacterium]